MIVALDSGAIIALAREDRRAIALLKHYRAREALFVVPAPVLAETLRGGRSDAMVHRAVKLAKVEPATEDDASDAGRRLGDTGSDQTVNALIVATAVRAGAHAIVIGDSVDISGLSASDLIVVSI